ncbi:tyrosyl-tRNA synthetase-like protein [Lophiostoma macrostomum CBS 122681]|uniref:Tyrosine--tRNA ligase n=1 Tax=Lophiostoma macrostomum CBS 122681 TaxID=1314788 RepID=A0A6A6THU9_9PLEO|nr:tyrosyl-tRNA synthetase-like protein [Lophiostoma macrostomum CBS 122681]
MAAISLSRQLPRARPHVCSRGFRRQCPPQRALWAGPSPDVKEEWKQKAERIRGGAERSMLDLLEKRGFVKDVAGGREALDWLMTEKRIGAYVGVDPTAPSLHVGHLLPLMALYWMWLFGFRTVTLLGGGTVHIGDPSGRTSARARQAERTHQLNTQAVRQQLDQLWVHVKCLGIKHQHPANIGRFRRILNNEQWLNKVSVIQLMKTMGSSMRLGTMLSRDSVRKRLEKGDGMSLSEFCYPLFQGYDWWHMYNSQPTLLQLQIGGSDQYGNICAGMEAVDHMRALHRGAKTEAILKDPLTAPFGLTTPLLTTASGEKFGKSANNAVWLDPDMLSSFDLYQYFLRTSDDDVYRYLKLFTFLPLDSILLVMKRHSEDASKRIAQHLLAKEIVELAHGAAAAREAETAHKEAFSHGTNSYPLRALRNTLRAQEQSKQTTPADGPAAELLLHKEKYLTSSSATTEESQNASSVNPKANTVTLPASLLRKGSFPHVLYASGLVPSRKEGRRMIESGGAYAVVPNSGSIEDPNSLRWEQIPTAFLDADPNHYLVDYEGLVLRVGKSKIQVCRVVLDARFKAEGLSCPGWEDADAKRDVSDESP